MLTIFSIPKPFMGHIATIQRNALQSWVHLRPACEIILCGDERGTEDVTAEFRVRHIPDVARNEYGTPLLNSVFNRVRQIAKHPLMCYINADIILLSDFLKAVERIRFRRFLMVGQRWDVEIGELWDFTPSDCEEQLRSYVGKHGGLHPPSGSDFFVFPSGVMWELPPFAVGRPGWDNWMIYRARAMRFPVVDISRFTKVIHQNHGYSHVTKGDGRPAWEGPEADYNRELAGSWDYRFTLADATHLLTRRILLPAIGPIYLWHNLKTLPILRPKVRPIIRPVGWLWQSMLAGFKFFSHIIKKR